MEIKKSEHADLEKVKTTSLLIGFVMVLALHFVALEWTQRDKKAETGEVYAGEISLEEEMIPITLPEQKTVPPQVTTVTITEVIEIVDDEVDFEEVTTKSQEDQTEFINIDDIPDVIVAPDEPDEEVPFQVVEKMPEFPGGNAALNAYLKKNIK